MRTIFPIGGNALMVDLYAVRRECGSDTLVDAFGVGSVLCGLRGQRSCIATIQVNVKSVGQECPTSTMQSGPLQGKGPASGSVVDKARRKSCLPVANIWMSCRRRSAEVSIQQMGVDVRKVCPVEEVENLKPELEIHPFGNPRVFVEVDVGFRKVWLAELAWLLIAL